MFISPDRVSASYDTLMRQAPATIEDWMNAVADAIDKRFGDGYAKKNPDMVASLVASSAVDFTSSCMCMEMARLSDRFESIASAISELAESKEP